MSFTNRLCTNCMGSLLKWKSSHLLTKKLHESSYSDPGTLEKNRETKIFIESLKRL